MCGVAAPGTRPNQHPRTHPTPVQHRQRTAKSTTVVLYSTVYSSTLQYYSTVSTTQVAVVRNISIQNLLPCTVLYTVLVAVLCTVQYGTVLLVRSKY